MMQLIKTTTLFNIDFFKADYFRFDQTRVEDVRFDGKVAQEVPKGAKEQNGEGSGA